MARFIKWLVASLIFVALLAWVEYEITWASVFSAWAHVSVSLLFGLTFLTFVSYFLRSYRVYFYFGDKQGHSLLTYVKINFYHNAWNNFLPMRLGEASFPLMMKREFDCPLLESASGLLWIRLMDLHWLLVLLSSLVVIKYGTLWIFMLAGLILFPLLLLCAPKYGGVNRIPAFRKIIETLQRYSPASVYHAGILYGLTACVWVIKLTALAVVLLMFIDISVLYAIFAVVSADLSSVLPVHGLAGSGTYEGAMLAALVPLGVAVDDVLLAAVNTHMYVLLSTVLSIPVAFFISLRR